MTYEDTLRALKKSSFGELEAAIKEFQSYYDKVTDKNIVEYSNCMSRICDSHYWSYGEYCELSTDRAISRLSRLLNRPE